MLASPRSSCSRRWHAAATTIESLIAKVGIHWATEQCRDLLDKNVRGIHFYTLNKSDATRQIYENLGVKDSLALRGGSMKPGTGTMLEPPDAHRLKAEAHRPRLRPRRRRPGRGPAGLRPLPRMAGAGVRDAGMELPPPPGRGPGHPRHVLEGVRSVVVVGMIYGRA